MTFSLPGSTPDEACLYTPEPFAAAAFGEFASAGCSTQLAAFSDEIRGVLGARARRLTLARPPKTGQSDPYPLQLADLEYAQRRQHTLVADEPGVGKTPTAIMYANLLAHADGRPEGFRALAVVPASIRLQWAARIRQWSTIPNTQISVVSTSQRGVPPTDSPIHWTVLSYDTARSAPIYKALLANSYDLLVLDEAHYLKSPSASRTRAVFGAPDRGSHISARARHVLALTGTPIPNRPREAYILAKAPMLRGCRFCFRTKL